MVGVRKFQAPVRNPIYTLYSGRANKVDLYCPPAASHPLRENLRETLFAMTAPQCGGIRGLTPGISRNGTSRRQFYPAETRNRFAPAARRSDPPPAVPALKSWPVSPWAYKIWNIYIRISGVGAQGNSASFEAPPPLRNCCLFYPRPFASRSSQAQLQEHSAREPPFPTHQHCPFRNSFQRCLSEEFSERGFRIGSAYELVK